MNNCMQQIQRIQGPLTLAVRVRSIRVVTVRVGVIFALWLARIVFNLRFRVRILGLGVTVC